jgi:type I restriction enzyme S subunit
MSEWKTVTLGEIANVVTGTTPPGTLTDNWGYEIPFLTPSDLSGADYMPVADRHLSVAAADRHSGRVVQDPAVAVVCIGATIGKVALINTPTLTNQQINTLIPIEGAADARFLYYRMQLERDRLQAVASGSATPIISKGAFSTLDIDIPAFDVQVRIAAVLGALDDLIETEQRTASLSDALWRAVVSSELGHREALPLASLASFVNGKNFTKGGGKLGLPVIRTPEVRSGPTSSTVRNDVPAAEDNIAQAGDILFVWSGSLLVSRWRWQPGLVNQHIFKVVPAAGAPDWLVLWAIEELMADFLGVAADKATTMGHIKRGDLDRLVAVPARSRWETLDAKIRPFWDEALAARIHASELARARDELLPLLMSGKVQVSEDLAVA